MFGSTPQASGGMFGAKPATSAFGSSAPSAFGQPAQSSGFGMGAASSSGFGGSGNVTSAQQNQGTGNPRFVVTNDKEGTGIGTPNSHFQTITAMPSYRNFSLEELRVQDYLLGKKVWIISNFGSFLLEILLHLPHLE